MKRLTRTPVYVTLIVAAVSLLLGVGIAGAASSSKPAYEGTFQMYANVDGEGHLGSNYDADGAKLMRSGLANTPSYSVTFNHPIGRCAAVVQTGKAGGPDVVQIAQSIVTPDLPNTFDVSFQLVGTGIIADPFMMTVTCAS